MPRLRDTLWSAAALAGLTACAAAGPVRSPDVAMPAAFERAAPAAAAPLDRWWQSFGDPQLTALIERALERGVDAREAAARLAEARATRRGALADYGLRGDLSASARAQGTEVLSGESAIVVGGAGAGGLPGGFGGFDQEGVARSANVDFDVSWEADLFGRRAAARREADATLAAARFEYEASRASLAGNVADALFEARGLAVQLDEARETERIQRSLRDLTRTRADRGLAAPSDTARIEADLAQAVAEVERLAAELRASKRALLVLTGEAAAPTEGLALTGELRAPPPVPASVPGELLARRPDVREAEARLAAASGRLRLDELALFPRFTLLPGAGLSTSSGGFADATTAIWRVGAGLALPILDRPRLLSQLRAQEARAEQAVVGYERAVQTAFSEADQTLVRLAADRRRFDELSAGERQAERSFSAAGILYERGLTDLPALLDAERTYRGARSARTGAQVQALRRTVQAFRALGGGWSPTEAGLDARGERP